MTLVGQTIRVQQFNSYYDFYTHIEHGYSRFGILYFVEWIMDIRICEYDILIYW